MNRQSPAARPLKMELLAPAGDFAVLEAALEAGADAVYLGLESLNARRRARNFSSEELRRAVAAAHERQARVFLALNVEVSERELGEAARMLELARSCGVDAVLVRDPALLALLRVFSELEAHFSTQAGATSSADVAAAGQLGARRVVLAREMSLSEIAAASTCAGVQTEVFVQGALCFSVSGRCLLSSWAGGRSGNRGACASPCRVPWTVDGEPAGTPLSMRDLSLWEHLDDLRAAGVAALKIEGRLKNADWVGRVVSLYRRALSGVDCKDFIEATLDFGAYTGRDLTSGYLQGRRDNLTGLSGRRPGATPASAEQPAKEAAAVYDLELTVSDKAVCCRCSWTGRAQAWTQPKIAVRRVKKAVSLADILHRLSSQPLQGLRLGQGRASDPAFQLPPRAANALVARLSAVLRLMRKKPESRVRIELPAAARDLLVKPSRAPVNDRCLGDAPDRVRLEALQLAAFKDNVPSGGAIVEGLDASNLERVAGKMSLVAALPQVFFESESPGLRALLDACRRRDIAVEVNSWGGWHLAREAGVRFEGGPGLPVLNSLAAKRLVELGFSGVTLSQEADKGQLADICSALSAPASVVVYGRPPLMTTRVELAAELRGRVFEDRRGIRMRPRLEAGLWVFRPVVAFDWRGLRDARIQAAHLIVDLVGSPDPLAEWRSPPSAGAFLFNYDRTLA